MKELFYSVIGLGALMGVIAIVILEAIIIGFIYYIKWLKNRKKK